MTHEDHVGSNGHVRKLRSAGRAVPGVELRIVSPQLDTLPSGQIGEIWVRGLNVMGSYWKEPEQTIETIIDGWVRTGDAGYIDTGGFLLSRDRG